MKRVEDYLTKTVRALGDKAAVKSERLRNLYRNDPDVLVELLFRFGVFGIIESDDDARRHNDGIKMMADIGMLGGELESKALVQMLNEAKTPEVYLRSVK